MLIANPNSNQGVNSIDVSKDGNLAAIADSTGIIGISKRGTNQITLIKHKKGVNHVSFSPQGKHFLTAHENGKINVWKVPITDDNGKKTSSQEPIITLGESFEWASWAEFSPDGNYIICTGNGQIEIWDWKKGKIVKFLEGSREVFNSVSLSPPHAHYILSTGDRDMLSIWKRQTGQVLQILSRNATTGCFSSDGKYIAASENGIVKVWHQKK